MRAGELRRLVEAVPEATNDIHGGYNSRWCGADGLCDRCRATRALGNALLASPVLDVVDAVERLGVARAEERAADRVLIRAPSDDHGREWGVAADAKEEAERAVHALADQLASGGEEG